MNREPIMIYENQEQLDASLKEWQTRLFLDDWIITARMVDMHDMTKENSAGECTLSYVNHEASIRILKSEHMPKDAVSRQCDECVLVHELLHCKMNFMENDHPCMEEAFYDAYEHALLEQIAKALIMEKHHISFGWFKAN